MCMSDHVLKTLALSGYFSALTSGLVCVSTGTVNAGGLCGGVVVFVPNAEYHADKPQSFTCNHVDAEVQLESKPAPKAAPFHSTPLHCLLKGSWEEVWDTSVW